MLLCMLCAVGTVVALLTDVAAVGCDGAEGGVTVVTGWTYRAVSLSWHILKMEMIFYLTTHSTHFIYGYMASDIWLRTILIVRKEICCRHTGYSFRLAARFFLYALSHRQDSTYHSLCYTSRGALAGIFWREKIAR